MSCENASAPLNLIKDTNMLEKCNIVCDYKANYPVCRGLVKNKGSFFIIVDDIIDESNFSWERFCSFLLSIMFYLKIEGCMTLNCKYCFSRDVKRWSLPTLIR